VPQTSRRDFGSDETTFSGPRLALAAALTVALAILAAPGPAQAADCVNPAGGVTVFTPGSPVRQCTVPAGVTRITVEAWGSQGGDNAHYAANTDKGGAGGHTLRSNFPVAPGQTLLVIGGQAGGHSGRTDGGAGGGGGSSGVYTYYPARSLSDVIVIAGAGGGAGCDDGGWGGGSFTGSKGGGGSGFTSHLCTDEGVPGSGGGDGAGGHGGRHAGSDGGSGFGGNGGESPSGGYGGWGGPDLAGRGGLGVKNPQGHATGGAGGGGFGGGGGGYQDGGGGGGSYPALNTVSPNWGNGRVQMSVSSTGGNDTLRIRRGPPGLTKRRQATFRFQTGGASKFSCRLTGRRVKADLRRWRQCGSSAPSTRGGKTYRGLRPGLKLFEVKATTTSGISGYPQRREWLIER